jgi:hypothetical protein
MTRSRAAPPKGGIAWMIVACSGVAMIAGVTIELGLVRDSTWGFPAAPAAIAAAAVTVTAIAAHAMRALLGRQTPQEMGGGHAGSHS